MGPHTIKALKHLIARYPLQAGTRILEVGSRSWNGSIRSMFKGFDYTGVDTMGGLGVDVANPFELPMVDLFSGKKFDLILCCDMLEHCATPWQMVADMTDVLADDGILLLLAPMAWPEHKCPKDYWRILPDGMEAMAKWSGLKVLECYAFPSGSFLPAFDSFLGILHWINGKRLGFTDWPRTGHAHTVCIARKTK